ncbi:MAG: hypothetical protein ACTHLR_08095 [Rhizomicrobium sp.]
MHAFVTVAAMTAIFAAHVAMMVELRPRRDKAPEDDKTDTPGDNT